MRVAVIHDYNSRAAELADWGQVLARAEVHFFSQRFHDEDEVVAALSEFEVICAMRELLVFSPSLLARLPRLALIVATGEANYQIDFAAAEARGVRVAGTPNGDFGRIATAELTWGLLLASTRNIVSEDGAVRNGRWQESVSRILYGKTLGLVGLGGVGRIIARYAQAFGMQTLAWSPHLTSAAAREVLVERAPLDDLLSRSDVVSLHLVPTLDTTKLIDGRALSLMKRSAVIVNTSRGALIDEHALVAALQQGTIAGAALDVYDREPLEPGHPLLTQKNVILSPHLAGFTEETLSGWYSGSIDAVLAYLDGREPPVRHRNRPAPDTAPIQQG